MGKASYIYILTNNRNEVIYIGVTSNLIKRIWEHKNKITPGFTKKYNIDKLVYYEQYIDIAEAIKREKTLKKWLRKWKIQLIEKQNPTWADLYDNIRN